MLHKGARNKGSTSIANFTKVAKIRRIVKTAKICCSCIKNSKKPRAQLTRNTDLMTVAKVRRTSKTAKVLCS